MATCTKCGNELVPGASFCMRCGTRVNQTATQAATCPNCGSELTPGAGFCMNCGTRVNSAPPAAPGPPGAPGYGAAPGGGNTMDRLREAGRATAQAAAAAGRATVEAAAAAGRRLAETEAGQKARAAVEGQIQRHGKKKVFLTLSLAVAAVVVVCVAVAGVGGIGGIASGGSLGNGIVGTWVVSRVEYAGQSYTRNDVAAVADLPNGAFPAYLMETALRFDKDGKFGWVNVYTNGYATDTKYANMGRYAVRGNSVERIKDDGGAVEVFHYDSRSHELVYPENAFTLYYTKS